MKYGVAAVLALTCAAVLLSENAVHASDDPYDEVHELARNMTTEETITTARARWSVGLALLSTIELTPSKVTPHRHCYYKTKLHLMLGDIDEGAKSNKECTRALIRAIRDYKELADILIELADGVFNVQSRELSECKAQVSSKIKIVAKAIVDGFEKRGVTLSPAGQTLLESAISRSGDRDLNAAVLANEVRVDWSKADWSRADWAKADWSKVPLDERLKAWSAWKDPDGPNLFNPKRPEPEAPWPGPSPRRP